MKVTPSTIINDNGGPTAFAQKLNMKPRTVAMWQFRKRIPRTVWPEIIETFPKVTMETLKASEQA